jgi:predicted signal transduction protein with EAL and GGDEF domain
LLRWNHRERGFISPATFIPVAEDSSLIVPVGDWVLREVSAAAAALAGGRPAFDTGRGECLAPATGPAEFVNSVLAAIGDAGV